MRPLLGRNISLNDPYKRVIPSGSNLNNNI